MRFFIVILLFVNLNHSFSQKQGNIWYFGEGAGLDFNSGFPVELNNGSTYSCLGHVEGTSTISDSSWALLFYTNGVEIWNRNHQIMQNGFGLEGSISATQSSLIVPLPGSSRFFYVFTVDGFICGNNLGNGLRYSIVDICMDGGLGGVILSSKNTPLLDSTSEKITAVKDANGTDYWIITHRHYSDAFYCFKLTSSGLSLPIISHSGSIHDGGNMGAIGQLKASPNGQKLSIASGNGNNHIEIFDFDNNTGVVSNPIILPRPFPDSRAYGTSFSPDNSKVYYTLISYSPIGTQIIQFDLNAGTGDSSSIVNSSTLIWSSTTTAISGLGLQIGPDEKVYCIFSNSVFNNPNLPGTLSDFQLNAYTLSSYPGYCFPNLVDSYDYENTIYYCTESIEENGNIFFSNIYPTPAENIVNIELNLSIPQECSLRIFNSQGLEVYTILEITNKLVTIERKNLPTGLYYFYMYDKNRIIDRGKILFN